LGLQEDVCPFQAVFFPGRLDFSASALNAATADAALTATLSAPAVRRPLNHQRQMQLAYAEGDGGGNRRSLDRYSSLDSSDTFLSCNTHPFPSQGSLAGLEELAAKGSMAANGSMPAVNIAGLNDPNGKRRRRSNGVQERDVEASAPSPSTGRRVRIAAARNASTDNELDVWADCTEDEPLSSEGPKHRRTRISQVSICRSFDIHLTRSQASPRPTRARSNGGSGGEDSDGEGGQNGRRKTSKGISAALSQGLQSLGEKLGKADRVRRPLIRPFPASREGEQELRVVHGDVEHAAAHEEEASDAEHSAYGQEVHLEEVGELAERGNGRRARKGSES